MLRNTRLTGRRGAILIVVLALLSLFAIVGITFVLVANQQAENQRIKRDAAGPDSGPPFVDDGQTTFARFISAFLYDEPDNGTGLQSSIRGHSLVATMYGRYSAIAPTPIMGGTTVAWNGTGNFSQATTVGVNRQFLINFRQFNGATQIYDPEIAGERAVGALPGSGAGSVHIPKNAPYTYPDINNLFLASICPATGEVLVPSYVRAATFGSLDRNNPNWIDPLGKYKILRPRPFEHPQFPYPPQNADGTTTGDVQNLPGGYVFDNSTGIVRYVSRNDSIWIDIGAPIITGRDGKRYKMLVAPLILDLDGRLNLSVHGNRMLPNSGALEPDNFVHTSGHGLGPWEVSLEKAFGAYSQEARNLVFQRGLARNRASEVQKKYAPRYGDNQEIPLSAQIAWTGFTAPAGQKALQYPHTTANMYLGQPVYAHGYSNLNALVPNHPALFNPTEWPGLTGFGQPRGFSLADTKLLSLRYAFSPSFYTGMDLATFAPNSLRGSFPVPNPNPPQQATQNPYRTDPAHTYRQLVTTHSFDLDRPGPSPALGQTTSAFAALGGLDLNRTLADYRIDAAQPLVPANMMPPNITVGTAMMTQGDIDRNRLAREIFSRLVAVTVNDVTIATIDTTPGSPTMGNVTIVATPGTAQFDALRGLAQLSANIVDYIDGDDVNTAFVWNPQNILDPYAAANYAELGNRVVFGTEKPRLTINEGYAEAVNDPADNAAQPATGAPHIRFWLEFLNSTNTPYSASINGPLGDGAVRLKYDPNTEQSAPAVDSPYIVEIVQNGKGAGGSASASLRVPAASAANVKGDHGAAAADIVYDFRHAAGTPQRIVAPANGAAGSAGMVIVAANVPPNPTGPEFNPFPAPAPAGVLIADPPGPVPGGSLSYNTVPLANAIDAADKLDVQFHHHVVLLRRLANPYLPFNAATNPYITIDVLDNLRAADRIYRDDMQMNPRNPQTAVGTAGFEPNAPLDSPLIPQSLGKVQPYAANSMVNNPAAPPTFPASTVLYQRPATVPTTAVRHTFGRQNSAADAAPTTATYIPGNPSGGIDGNLSGETIMTPFDWLAHLDRPIINQIELLHVSAGKPHELTLNFLHLNTLGVGMGRDVQKSAHTAHWLPVAAPHPFVGPTHPYSLYPSLYRALDLLRIQPYGHQTALGGRIPGRININTIQDIRVFRALFDAQPGNGFDDAFVDSLWTALMQSRSGGMALVNKVGADGTTTYPTPVIGATVYDSNTATGDRPFLPLGAATIPLGGSTIGTATAFGGGTGLDDTLLRRNTATGEPTIMLPKVLNAGDPELHPYQRIEALRKVLNNTTTVSNVFAVWVTVGYFEVTTPAGTAPEAEQWGKEYYLEIPGDMRQRLFAIVDRTQIGLDPTSYQNFLVNNTVPPTHATTRPFFTTVESNVAASPTTPTTINIAASSPDGTTVQVYSDGVPVYIVPFGSPAGVDRCSTIVIGSGADREIVNVTAVSFTPATPTTPAFATLTVPSLAKDHTIGTCVSNIVPGNPGQPANFSLPLDDLSPFRTVIPHWSRVP